MGSRSSTPQTSSSGRGSPITTTIIPPSSQRNKALGLTLPQSRKQATKGSLASSAFFSSWSANPNGGKSGGRRYSNILDFDAVTKEKKGARRYSKKKGRDVKYRKVRRKREEKEGSKTMYLTATPTPPKNLIPGPRLPKEECDPPIQQLPPLRLRRENR